MVKNTKGGKGAKSMARKNTNLPKSEQLVLPTESNEMFACVTKLFGNGRCEVHTNNNATLKARIPGKFRGRNKRSNIVSMYSIVLVGVYDFTSAADSCDILYIYDDQDLEQIRYLPGIDISDLIRMKMSYSYSTGGSGAVNDDVLFTNDLEEEKIQALNEINPANSINSFKLEETEQEIDIDDI